MTTKELKQMEFAQKVNQEIISKHSSIKVKKIEQQSDLLADNIVATLKPSKAVTIRLSY